MSENRSADALAAVLGARAGGEPCFYLDDARKLCEELLAAGYKILPREPTEAMQRAAAECAKAMGDDIHPVTAHKLRAAWDAAP